MLLCTHGLDDRLLFNSGFAVILYILKTDIFCEIEIIFVINQFQTIQSSLFWKKILKNNSFWFLKKNSPYSLNDPHRFIFIFTIQVIVTFCHLHFYWIVIHFRLVIFILAQISHFYFSSVIFPPQIPKKVLEVIIL